MTRHAFSEWMIVAAVEHVPIESKQPSAHFRECGNPEAPPHPKQGRMWRLPSRRISRLVCQRIVETGGYDGACGKFCVF
jgi:hypothetical protein